MCFFKDKLGVHIAACTQQSGGSTLKILNGLEEPETSTFQHLNVKFES